MPSRPIRGETRSSDALQPPGTGDGDGEELDVSSCTAHFDRLASAEGLRHPADFLDESSCEARGGGRGAPCEALVYARNRTVHILGARKTAPFAHGFRVVLLQQILALLPPTTEFIAGISTHDRSDCDARRLDLSNVELGPGVLERARALIGDLAPVGNVIDSHCPCVTPTGPRLPLFIAPNQARAPQRDLGAVSA